MQNKGRAFTGMLAGANYKRWAGLFGFNAAYYRRAIGNIRLEADMKALDLGCGPGALCFALAENAPPATEIYSLDLAEDQLVYARQHAGTYPCTLIFQQGSMDALPFPDDHFDVVMTSMALHATPPEVRRATIAETARVLKPNGRFLLVDWSKPKFGLWGIFWFPFVRWGEMNQDNWNNTYRQICEAQGFNLEEDAYIMSIARRQVFRKKKPGTP
jgi:ubiquinone/menaquinone biosynthesis C-methylase UbiE